jgi:hypothetical protein
MRKDHTVQVVEEEYAQDVGGWWHEMMYDFIHGKKSGASTFDKNGSYEQWKEHLEARDGQVTAAAA